MSNTNTRKHYGSDGRCTGYSISGQGRSGNQTYHYDNKGRQIGTSYRETTFWGNSRPVYRDANGKKKTNWR